MVMSIEVPLKGAHGIIWSISPLDDHMVALKKAVPFVPREKELIRGNILMNQPSHNNLTVVLEILFVRPRHLC
jgi:hypothetical protein